MATLSIPKIEYKRISQEQKKISKAVSELEIKFKILGTLKDFERLAEWGRQFAKKRSIKPSLVLRND